MKRTINFGVLGTGRMASRMVEYIRESNNSDVSAVFSRRKDKAVAFANKFGIKQAYGDSLSLMDDNNIDAAYIALPNSMHFEYCKQALEHGKHVLCEKPLVLESKQLDILVTIAKKKNLKIMECFWYRFHPLVDMVIGSIKRDLGAPLGFYSTVCFMNASESDVRWNPDLGGGALFDLACYHIDAVNYICKPEIAELTYLEAFSRQRNGVEANITIEALFSKKFQMCVSSSIDRQSINRTTIVGTEASLIIPNLMMAPEIKESFFYLIKNGKMQRMDAGTGNPYALMVKAFSDSIIKDATVPVAIAESKKNLILLEAVKRSLRLEMHDRVALYPKVKRKFRTIFSTVKQKWGK